MITKHLFLQDRFQKRCSYWYIVVNIYAYIAKSVIDWFPLNVYLMINGMTATTVHKKGVVQQLRWEFSIQPLGLCLRLKINFFYINPFV